MIRMSAVLLLLPTRSTGISRPATHRDTLAQDDAAERIRAGNKAHIYSLSASAFIADHVFQFPDHLTQGT